MRICYTCKIEKSDDNFPNVRKTYCKECAKVAARNKRNANLADAQKYGREYLRKVRTTPLGKARHLWRAARQRAKESDLEFDLSIHYVEIRLMIGVCSATGMKFDLSRPTGKAVRNPMAPSIDRIDPFKGYVDGNIQVVVWAYNLGKGQMSDQEYKEFIKASAEFMRDKE